MPNKRDLFFLAILVGLSISAAAQECRRWASTVVVFAEGSSVLDRDQIALIANRLDHFRRLYPDLDSVDLEGVARDNAPDAKQLAQRRAAATAHAVRTLFDGVKLHVSSHVYPPDWIDRGAIKGILSETLHPINAANLRQAHAKLESGTMIGKLVVTGW